VVLNASAHFDAHYRKDPDPWGYRHDFAERRRHLLMIDALPHPRYMRAFEPACGNGEFTTLLADRCEHLEAWDVSTVAVALAKEKLEGKNHVAFSASSVPDQWPTPKFDLVVLADFSYYLTPDQVLAVKRKVDFSMMQQGHVLTMNWTGTAHDFVSDNMLLHEIFRSDETYESVVKIIDPRLTLEIWEQHGS
jgi:SAM-dependent methyltransferase